METPSGHDAPYDLAIVGGGIIGTAALYVASRYTNLRSIALFEKYGFPATVNSHSANNSQTLHTGDIETNYTLEKARTVKAEAELLQRYLERRAPASAFRAIRKMVLAVGEDEVQQLEKRYKAFKAYYPDLHALNRREIAAREPKVVEARDPDEPIFALSSECYAVDFGAVSASFIRDAQTADRPPDIFLAPKFFLWRETASFMN